MSVSRRKFIEQSVLGLAAFSIVPRHVLGKGFLAPSDQLTKAIIGTGGMGRGHIPYAGTRVVALCDVDKKNLQLGLDKVEKGVKSFHDYREMIQLPEVDIVHVATPPHWHGIMAADAARAGKDIWCEKPMKKVVDSGLLGWPLKFTVSKHTGFDWKFYWVGKTDLTPQPVPLELDYESWLGPAPYKPYNVHRTHQTFRGYWDYDGGALGDMGQHYLDPIQYMLGKDNESPVYIEVDAPVQDKDAVGIFNRITYTYADGCQIVLDGEAKDEKVAYIEGPKGKLYRNMQSDIPDLMKKLAEFPDPVMQQTDFVDSVKNRKKFALNEENGYRSCTLINLGLIAMRVHRNLKFDPINQVIVGDDEANRLMDQPMRAPYIL